MSFLSLGFKNTSPGFYDSPVVLPSSGGSNEFTQIHFEAKIGNCAFFVCILLRTNGKQTVCHTILSYFLRWSTPLFLSPTVNSISRCVTFPKCNSNGVYSRDCLQHGVLTHFVNLAISLVLLRLRIHHILSYTIINYHILSYTIHMKIYP